MKNKKKLCIRWIRVSSSKQDENHSKPAQLKSTSDYCKQNGLDVWKTYEVTETASKEKNRREFVAMMNSARENGIKHIVCDKVDRAARGYWAAFELTQFMEEYGGTLHVSRERFRFSQDSAPNEKFLFGISILNGKFQVDNMRMELSKGFSQRFHEDGKWNHLAPIGYQHIRIGKKSDLHLNKKEAPHVKEAFMLYKTGNYTQQEILNFLTGKIEHRKISTGMVDRMLANPFYYGLMKTKYGKRMGVHEPLISKKDFDDIQRIRGQRAEGHFAGTCARVLKPLMGLMKCGDCGASVTGETHRKPSGRQYTYYHCANRHCSQRRKNIRQEVIFAQIVQAFAPFGGFTPKGTRALIAGFKRHAQGPLSYAYERGKELHASKEVVQSKLAKMEKLRADGLLEESEYQEIIREKKRSLDSLESEIKAISDDLCEVEEESLRVIELFGKASNFMELAPNSLDKARLARAVLSNPILKDATLYFSYQKPFDNLLKIPLDNKWWRCRQGIYPLVFIMLFLLAAVQHAAATQLSKYLSILPLFIRYFLFKPAL